MMFDMCNQFVVQAVAGGLLGLVAYIAIFSKSFGAIGKARKNVEGDRRREWFLWCMGSTLFSVVVAHFGINYPATTEIGLFIFWTAISVATFEANQPVAEEAEIPRDSYLSAVSSSVAAESGWMDMRKNLEVQKRNSSLLIRG